MLIVDPMSLARVVQHSPFQFYAFAYRPELSLRSRAHVAVRAYAHDDHYLTRSKFNSLFTEMITPQINNTNIYIYIYIILYIYRIAGNFRGMLIFVIFVVDLAVTKFPTHEN